MREEAPQFQLDNPRPNELASFVIDSLSSYDDLHADSPEEGKEKFNAATIAALQTSNVGEQLGLGFFNTVYELQDNEQVVVKIVGTAGYDAEAVDARWKKIQDEHRTVVAYLGSRFVPDTEFTVIGHRLEPDAGSAGEESALEYVLVQERMFGQNLEFCTEPIQASPELKAEAAEYIARYERMMRDGIAMDHPDDLMVNDTPGATRRLAVLDTNYLTKLTDIANNRNTGVFLREYGIDPTSIQKQEDLEQTLRGVVPRILGLEAQEAAALQNQDYYTFMERLRGGGDLLPRLMKSLRRVPRDHRIIPPYLRDNPYLDELLPSGFGGLVAFADKFAPAGRHPRDIMAIMAKLGITDTGTYPTNN